MQPETRPEVEPEEGSLKTLNKSEVLVRNPGHSFSAKEVESARKTIDFEFGDVISFSSFSRGNDSKAFVVVADCLLKEKSEKVVGKIQQPQIKKKLSKSKPVPRPKVSDLKSIILQAEKQVSKSGFLQ